MVLIGAVYITQYYIEYQCAQQYTVGYQYQCAQQYTVGYQYQCAQQYTVGYQ